MLKIATFNCENLFSRPRIFTEPFEECNKCLDEISELKKELEKPIFDHTLIQDLKKSLSGYAIVNDIRGSHMKAKGADEWIGNIELVRLPVTENALVNTARVIKDVNADIFSLIEIEDRLTLQKFHDKYIVEELGGKPYEFILSIDGNDDRGIDAAVISRYQIKSIKTHIFDKTKYLGKFVPLFDRDCLEVEIDKKGTTVTLLINHFKSMGYNSPKDFLGNEKRYLQAKRVNEVAKQYDLAKSLVVITGDLNSSPESKSLSPILTNKQLHNLVETLPKDQQGTYRTGKQQLDYIIASEALVKQFNKVEIERHGIYSKKYEHYSSIKSRRDEASDHAAVVATFDI